jgi:hypothetical protein
LALYEGIEAALQSLQSVLEPALEPADEPLRALEDRLARALEDTTQLGQRALEE